MAYNPNTGAWSYEDDSVEGRVKGLVDVNNPLMQQARTQGMQTANRRGLLNSSIAGGEAQKAVIDKAVPIATADAQIVNNKNISRQGFVQQGELNTQQNLQQDKIVGIQESGMNARLAQELGSRERVAAGEAAAAKERLGMTLTSNERIALDDRNGALERLNISETGATNRLNISETGANTRLATSEAGANTRLATSEAGATTRLGISETGANTRLATSEAGANTRLATSEAGATTRLGISETGANTRLGISETGANNRAALAETGANNRNNASINANAAQYVAQNTVTLAGNRNSSINAINSNPNIPADARAGLINQIETYYGADIETLASVANVTIPYRPATTQAPAAPAATAGGGTGDTTAISPYGSGSGE